MAGMVGMAGMAIQRYTSGISIPWIRLCILFATLHVNLRYGEIDTDIVRSEMV